MDGGAVAKLYGSIFQQIPGGRMIIAFGQRYRLDFSDGFQ